MLRFSYTTLLIVVVAIAFLVTTTVDPFSGDTAWVALISTVGIAALVRWKTKGIPLAATMFAVVAAHAFGYKIYGSPQIVKVTLQSPSSIERLEKPNTLILSDGSQHKLDGVTFTQNVSLRPTQHTLDQMTQLGMGPQLNPAYAGDEFAAARVWWMLCAPRRKRLHAGDAFQAELTPAANNTVHGQVLLERHYWCGNSFFARIYPQNLPSASKHDLGVVLVRAGLATPNTNDAEYRYQLELAEDTKFMSAETIR